MHFSISFPKYFLQTCVIPLNSFLVIWNFPVWLSHLQFKSMYSIRFNYISLPCQKCSPFSRASIGVLSSCWIPMNCPSCLTAEMFSFIFRSFWYQFHACFNSILWLPFRYFWDSYPKVYMPLRFSFPGTIFQMSFWWEVQLQSSSLCFKMALINDPQEPCQSLNDHTAP